MAMVLKLFNARKDLSFSFFNSIAQFNIEGLRVVRAVGEAI